LDLDIQKALQSEASLQHFRAHTGIPCRTLEEAKRVIRWSKDNDESLQDIASTGGKFDRTKCELKPNSVDHGFLRGLALLAITLSTIGLVFALVFWQSDAAWVWLKDGSPHFALTKNSAQPIFHKKAALRAQDCGGKIDETLITATGFSSREIAQVCEIFQAKDLDTFVKNLVEQQKFLSLWISPYFIFFGLMSLNFWWTNSATKDMLGRLQKRIVEKNSTLPATCASLPVVDADAG
jgi:hypothetical protein